MEVLEKLSSISGIQIPQMKKDKNFFLYETLRNTVIYYHESLLSEDNKTVLENLMNERKLSINTIKEFRIGLSKENRNLRRYLKNKLQIDDNALFKTGLFYKDGNKIKERYADRIIIPINNFSGKTVGLGGRIISGGMGAKYINSSENPIFKKSFLLFNAHRAFPVIKVLDFCIIVEGYFDAISMWNKGIKNVVGVLGTNISSFHLKNIKNFTNNVMVFFDSDKAGMEAAFKAVDKLEEEGFSVAVVLMKQYKDPGELCANEDYTYVKSVISGAISGCEFKVHYFSQRVEIKNVEGKRKLINYLKPFIMKYLKSGDELNYRRIIKILSERTLINEDALIRGLRGTKKLVNLEKIKKFSLREKELLSIYFNIKEERESVLAIVDELFKKEKIYSILPFMKKNLELEEMAENLHSNDRAALIEISDLYIDKEKAENIIYEYENVIERKNIISDLEKIKYDLLQEKDKERKRELLKKSVELRKKIN